MKVKTSYPPSFFMNKKVYVLNRVYKVNKVKKYKGDSIIMKFEGVNDINQAEILRNLYVEVDEKDLEPLKEDEYYVYQLLGCKILDENYGFLGTVKDMHQWAPYWTLEIINDKEILIPFVSEYIVSVDVKQKVIRTRLPKGYVENF